MSLTYISLDDGRLESLNLAGKGMYGVAMCQKCPTNSQNNTALQQPCSDFRLLIVEDDPTLRIIWKITLESWGMSLQVAMAEDGYVAIVQIAAARPDLIITDIGMPNIDGRMLIDIVSRVPSTADIPFVVVSGLKADDLLDRPSVIGCYPKPIPFYEIHQLITQLVQRRAPAKLSLPA
ncbi:response regulator [Azonexus fungiphilus]